ncbi:MAG TPA: 50S ribosomal protein L17 [Bacteroidota bacterium]|jgi:large subunit ribosomal protein L17
MRHRKSGRKLKRTASHRKATLNALCTALFRHKKIRTTLAKAKETRMVAEKLLTRAKNAAAEGSIANNVHARRQVARFIKDREVVKELFGEIATKIGNRPGGYTRVVKLGRRFGDGGEVAIIELVDFNTGEAPAKKAKAAKESKKGAQKEAKKEADKEVKKERRKGKTEEAAAEKESKPA